MPPWWSTDEDRLLRQLYEQGAPLRAIAARVGRSPDAVSERRR
jgi:DNA-binding Lrp family transcriptional regulator